MLIPLFYRSLIVLQTHLQLDRVSVPMVFSICFPKAGANALTRSTSEEKKRNLEIDKMIRKDKKLQARQVKILLLGWCFLTAYCACRWLC